MRLASRIVGLCLLVFLVSACTQIQRTVRQNPSDPPFIHPYLVDWEVVEVAPRAVEGRAPQVFREQLREGLYRALLHRHYSPLLPKFVDSDEAAAASAFQLRAGVEEAVIQSDGAVVATAWVALLAPDDRGGETLYLSQVTNEVVAQPGQAPAAAAAIAGRGLAERLLRALPAR